jgi:hypothetical protein
MIQNQQRIESKLLIAEEMRLTLRGRQPESFQYGRFQAVYLPKGGGWGVKKPRNDKEAQQ